MDIYGVGKTNNERARKRLIMKTLTEMMKDIQAWSTQNFGDNKGIHEFGPLVGMMEELGELSHAVLKKHQDIRHEDWQGVDYLGHTPAEDALADIFVYALDFAWRVGIQDPQQLLESVLYKQVLKRRWRELVECPYCEVGKLPEEFHLTWDGCLDCFEHRCLDKSIYTGEPHE